MDNFINDGKKDRVEDSFEIRVKKKPKTEDEVENVVKPVSKEEKGKFKLDTTKIKNTSKGDLANELLKILKN